MGTDTDQGRNISKAYKALIQDGLLDHDAIGTLRKQYPREHIPPVES